MQTLSYGIKKPQTGDKGGGANGFWAALEFDLTQLNNHNHDGSDSALLDATSFVALTQNIVAAGWTASGSNYRQLVTMPGVTTFDNFGQINFRDTATKAPLLLGIEKVSSNTFYVYINDPSLDVTIYYGT